MLYSNKFVLCVLVDGKPVDEKANGTVVVEFGSEYKLRFRNKNSRRAVVKISLDGENVSGGGYVIPAHSFIDIERHHDVAKRFKFVSLDSGDAIDHGKNGPNEDKKKGVIEATFFLEKEEIRPPVWTVPMYVNNLSTPWNQGRIRSLHSGPTCDSYLSGSSAQNAMHNPDSDGDRSIPTSFNLQYLAAVGANSKSMPVKDGCTVEGGHSSQQFRSTHIDTESEGTVIKLFLQGHEPVTKPLEYTIPNAVLTGIVTSGNVHAGDLVNPSQIGLSGYVAPTPTAVTPSNPEPVIISWPSSETDTQRQIREAEQEVEALKLKVALAQKARLLKQLEELSADV